MGNLVKPSKMRWFWLAVLTLSSVVFTGCEKGSLGVKSGSVQGYVLDASSNTPIADVYLRAEGGSGGHNTREAYTGGDGRYFLSDMSPGGWTIKSTKYGYIPTVGSSTGAEGEDPFAVVTIQNGETIEAPIILMARDGVGLKGTLKGYPVDGVTGQPLSNFTVLTPISAKPLYKVFESAQDFKETGWTLTAGKRSYEIVADNYNTFKTMNMDAYGDGISLYAVPIDLGVIQMDPLRVGITGTIRNVPGYMYGTGGNTPDTSNWVIWAEAAGKVVASTTAGTGFSGTVVYELTGVPITAGSVSIKCKIRGYDVLTINPSVSLPKQRPGGVIAGIDLDMHTVEPLKRDVRVIIQGSAPSEDGVTPSNIADGEVIRVYIQQGGKDIVPYVDVVARNQLAEAYFSGVVTGYAMDFLAVNLNRGAISGAKAGVQILENGNSIQTILLTMGGSE